MLAILRLNFKTWGTRVYLWRIHVDIWQNQYNIVKLNNKIKFKKKTPKQKFSFKIKSDDNKEGRMTDKYIRK